MGTPQRSESPPRVQVETVSILQARRIQLLDDHGRLRAQLLADDRRVALVLIDRRGAPRGGAR